MGAISKQYAEQQLKRFQDQLSHLDKLKLSVDQRKHFKQYYTKEINFWQGWVNTFKEIDQPKANQITVEYENIN